MGLPAEKLVIATNENDILHRFWQSGYYEKKPVHSQVASLGLPEDGVKAHEEGAKETYSPAMDILVSSNFERLLWYLAFDIYGHGSVEEKRKVAGAQVKKWLEELKASGGFGVDVDISRKAKEDFESERVSDPTTLETIASIYSVKTPAAKHGASQGTEGMCAKGGYILDPHTAIGVAAARRSTEREPKDTHHIVLATAHPAKFSHAVELALKDNKSFAFPHLLPEQFKGLESLPRRVTSVARSEGLAGVRSIIRSKVPSMATHVKT